MEHGKPEQATQLSVLFNVAFSDLLALENGETAPKSDPKGEN